MTLLNLTKRQLKVDKKIQVHHHGGSNRSMLDALDRLNKKQHKTDDDTEGEEPKLRPTKADIKTVMSTLYNTENPLDKAAEEMFLVGNTMFTTAIQYIVTRSLFTDPSMLADKLVKEDPAAKALKKTQNVKALGDYLHAECVEKPSTTSHPRNHACETATRELRRQRQTDAVTHIFSKEAMH